jgi:hypothetical protein
MSNVAVVKLIITKKSNLRILFDLKSNVIKNVFLMQAYTLWFIEAFKLARKADNFVSFAMRLKL